MRNSRKHCIYRKKNFFLKIDAAEEDPDAMFADLKKKKKKKSKPVEEVIEYNRDLVLNKFIKHVCYLGGCS